MCYAIYVGYAAMRRGSWLGVILVFAPLSAVADDVWVAVASNFSGTLTQLQTVFEKSSTHRLRISSGASGKLFAQITNGAPFTVYLAADRDYPRRLVKSGHAEPATQFTYATGRLVVWSTTLRIAPDLRELIRPEVRHIAIANPESAPYGVAASRALAHFGLADATRAKLVMGENVAQTAQFVATGNAEAGFVALAQLLVLPEASRGYFVEIPETVYPSLAQDAVLLRAGRDSAAARAFLDFLRGETARTLIRRAGYN